MDYQCLTLEVEGHLARLTLNRPQALNAVSDTMIRELNQVLGDIENPVRGARCLLITGAGRGFCSGADLSDEKYRQDGEIKVDLGDRLAKLYNPLFIRLRNLNMPIVTAVNGPAAGVGMSLALMGDMVLAARSAYFLQAFRHIGLIPDGGATYILPRLIGFARAMELSLMGTRLSAEKALEWGLINQVFDNEQLMPAALELARNLAAGPTTGLSLIRQAYWQSLDNSYEEQLGVERDLQRQAGRTQDFFEGVAAFLEKRPAEFTGK